MPAPDRRLPSLRPGCARALPLLALLALSAAAAPASAQLICTEPLMPVCAQDSDAIASEQQRALCLDDLKKYETQLEEYVGCVRDTADAAEKRRTAAVDFRLCLEENAPADCEPLE